MGKDDKRKDLNNKGTSGNTGNFSASSPTDMLNKLKQIKREQAANSSQTTTVSTDATKSQSSQLIEDKLKQLKRANEQKREQQADTIKAEQVKSKKTLEQSNDIKSNVDTKKPENQKEKHNTLNNAKQDAESLLQELEKIQRQRNAQKQVEKAETKPKKDKFDVGAVLARAKQLRIENGTEQEYLELIEAEKKAKEQLEKEQKEEQEKQAKLQAEREAREKKAIKAKQKELDRPLTEEEIIQLKNKLLLEEAAQNEEKKKKKKKFLFLLILLLCLLFAAVLALGIWYFYDKIVDTSEDGSVRVSIKIDDTTWYDYDIDEGAFKDKVVEPGDSIYPNIVVRNSNKVEGDGSGIWDSILLRFRAYMLVDGKLLPNSLIIEPISSSTEKWYTYDKRVEDTLIDLSGNPIVTESDGWYYLGGLLGPNQAVGLVNSITFNGETVGNEVAGKQCSIVIEVQAISKLYVNNIIDRECITPDGEIVSMPIDQADTSLYWVKAPEAWIRYMRDNFGGNS